MPTPCLVCEHPDRNDAEQALLSGSSHRQVAKALGVSRHSVDRHVANAHVSALLRSSTQAVETIGAADIAGQVITLAERALALLTRAEHDDDRATQVAAMREVRGILTLLSSVRIEQEKEQAKLEAGKSEPIPDLDAELLRRLLDVQYGDNVNGDAEQSAYDKARNGHMAALEPGPIAPMGAGPPSQSP